MSEDEVTAKRRRHLQDALRKAAMDLYSFEGAASAVQIPLDDQVRITIGEFPRPELKPVSGKPGWFVCPTCNGEGTITEEQLE